jgi:hypothetical protein
MQTKHGSRRLLPLPAQTRFGGSIWAPLPMAHYVSSSDSSSDLDEDLLSLHQADSQSSHTTLRSNSPATQGGQVIHQPPAVTSVACEHITELLGDPPRAERLLRRHKTFVRWGAQIRQDAAEISARGEPPSKRRKVRPITLHPTL